MRVMTNSSNPAGDRWYFSILNQCTQISPLPRYYCASSTRYTDYLVLQGWNGCSVVSLNSLSPRKIEYCCKWIWRISDRNSAEGLKIIWQQIPAENSLCPWKYFNLKFCKLTVKPKISGKFNSNGRSSFAQVCSCLFLNIIWEVIIVVTIIKKYIRLLPAIRREILLVVYLWEFLIWLCFIRWF